MRETKEVVLIDNDKKLKFVLTQMSATAQEDWINRAILLFINANGKDMGQLQKTISSGNVEAIMGLFSGLDYDKIKPLYDKLLTCAEYVPDETNPTFREPLNATNVDSIISEVKNLYKLRLEALKLCLSFFKIGETSPQAKATPAISIPKHM